MLLTLSANALRASLLPPAKGKRPKIDLLELPGFARQTLGLHGLQLTTELLAGADRARLEALRERADKAGCAVLLLSERTPQPFGTTPAAAESAHARMARVLEAAQLLGASAVSLAIESPNTDAAFNNVVERLKAVAERAERLDLNVLVSPGEGLTAAPDRVTDLIKRVGGFRVGTFPDFQTAAGTPDPAAYLRRLTPYAAALCAATVAFEEAPEPAPAKPVGTKPAAAPGTPAGDDAEDADENDMFDRLAEELMLGGLDDDDEDADPMAELDDDDEPAVPVRRVPKHVPYDLNTLIAAVASVGYDGPLSIDYRGEGDVTLGLERSRDALSAALARAPKSD